MHTTLTISAVHCADLHPVPIRLLVCTLDDGVLMLTRGKGYSAVVRDAPDSEHVRQRFDAEASQALWELVSASGVLTPGDRMVIEVRQKDEATAA